MAFRKTIQPTGVGWFCEKVDNKAMASLVLSARDIFFKAYGKEVLANELVNLIMMTAVELENKIDFTILCSNSSTEIDPNRYIFQQRITKGESDEVYKRFNDESD